MEFQMIVTILLEGFVALVLFKIFDFIDDYEVSKALLDTVVAWGKERGYTGIIGPIGFTDMDHEGMLIEGYEEFNMSMTFYNYPYYLEHMNKLKLEKEVDWVEYQVIVPEKPNEKLDKLSEFIRKRNGYELVTYTDRKVLSADAFEAFKVIDIAFSKLSIISTSYFSLYCTAFSLIKSQT